jgi:hypothetical protein
MDPALAAEGTVFPLACPGVPWELTFSAPSLVGEAGFQTRENARV